MWWEHYRPPASRGQPSPGQPVTGAPEGFERSHTDLYTERMSETTIRVDSRVRDQLRALAEEDHTTLGTLLERLAEREQYQREMRRANEAMHVMEREEPGAWHEYLGELSAITEGTCADGLPDAAAEWPEYNESTR
jgi:hypothetical protein